MTKPRFPLRIRPLLLALCSALLLTLSACARGTPANDEPLLVFAASSLRDALAGVASEYRARGGDSVVMVFGSTGDLSTQIANGAPADLFFAADAETIAGLSARGTVIEDSREVYAVGQLALIARCTRADTAGRLPTTTRAGTAGKSLATARAATAGKSLTTTRADELAAIECPRITLQDLAKDSLRTIAIADPSHAPYGRAAKQALERAGLWASVSPKLVLGANISQAELFVTSGNADAGIVALSLLKRDDQRESGSDGRTHNRSDDQRGEGRADQQRSYTLIDSSLHEPLVHAVAIVARSTRQAQARALLVYMRSSAGRVVMERYGFAPPPAGAAMTRATSGAPATPEL